MRTTRCIKHGNSFTAPWRLVTAGLVLGLAAGAAHGQATPAGAAALPVLQIHADQVKAKSSPLLYGLMTEEINHSYEGGLYAELVSNRMMKDNTQTPAHWTLVQDGGGAGDVALDTTQPVNAALDVALKLDATTAGPGQRVGVANDGFWGIPVKPNTTYRASFFAKAGAGFTGPVNVALESNDGKTVFAQGQVAALTPEWQQYNLELKTGNVPASETNRLVLSVDKPGTVWFDLVSLFPPTYNNRPNGNRVDLMELMAAMHPAFLRFPGGNYVEGNAVANRYDWKKTIGPVAERPGHMDDAWGYYSTDGLGLLEFLEWCEDLKMEPVLAVYAGLSMRAPAMPPGPGLDPYVQDALEEIEYVTGNTSTKWGAQRAKDGHPEPFQLHYVEIGNEDNLNNGPQTYDGRFAQFNAAIKAKYPDLQVIATTNVRSVQPDFQDDHSYFNSSQAARQAATRYDNRNRQGTQVMFGEYATQTGGYQNRTRPETANVDNALGDAAFLTGLERNSDVVRMASYAPLFINMNPGATQWRTDLIGYDALNSFGSVSYYVQKMFSTHHGDEILATDLAQGRPFYYSVTRDSATGTIYVKVVNPTPEAQPLQLQVDGAKGLAATGKMEVISGSVPARTEPTAEELGQINQELKAQLAQADPAAAAIFAQHPNYEPIVIAQPQVLAATEQNTLAEPMKVVPVESALPGVSADFTHTFPAFSVTMLELPAGR